MAETNQFESFTASGSRHSLQLVIAMPPEEPPVTEQHTSASADEGLKTLGPAKPSTNANTLVVNGQ